MSRSRAETFQARTNQYHWLDAGYSEWPNDDILYRQRADIPIGMAPGHEAGAETTEEWVLERPVVGKDTFVVKGESPRLNGSIF